MSSIKVSQTSAIPGISTQNIGLIVPFNFELRAAVEVWERSGMKENGGMWLFSGIEG